MLLKIVDFKLLNYSWEYLYYAPPIKSKIFAQNFPVFIRVSKGKIGIEFQLR